MIFTCFTSVSLLNPRLAILSICTRIPALDQMSNGCQWQTRLSFSLSFSSDVVAIVFFCCCRRGGGGGGRWEESSTVADVTIAIIQSFNQGGDSRSA